MLVQGSASLWPKIDAAVVITARGYPMAWIYRGDKLAASGWFQREARTAAHRASKSREETPLIAIAFSDSLMCWLRNNATTALSKDNGPAD